MKKILTILFVSLASVADAEFVRLDFNVSDNFGQPAEGIAVHIKSRNKLLLPYIEPGYKKMECTTDKNGKASKKFLYWGDTISCYLKGDGFYTESLGQFSLWTTYDCVTNRPPKIKDSKTFDVVMCKKINPIPLYSFPKPWRRTIFGRNETISGYDLKRDAWLPPHGTGEVADFYIHHRYSATNGVIHCEAEMIFPDGGGAYVVKGDGELPRPMVYRADPEMEFKDHISVARRSDEKTKKCLSEEFVLGKKDALVIRSRVERDAAGKIIRANYSKIYGPFTIAQIFDYQQIFFNPTVNDTNLEFDRSHNLSGQTAGTFYP